MDRTPGSRRSMQRLCSDLMTFDGFFLACEDFGGRFDDSFIACALFIYLFILRSGDQLAHNNSTF